MNVAILQETKTLVHQVVCVLIYSIVMIYAKGTTSCLVCASAAPDSDDGDDQKIDLILRRVTKVLDNLTVVPPVCFTVHSQLSLVVVLL